MSDTPETDTFKFGYSVRLPSEQGGGVAICFHSNDEWADFACKLERECNEARAELLRCKDVLLVIAERDQLRKVTDELAWCLKEPVLESCGYNSLPHVIERNNTTP